MSISPHAQEINFAHSTSFPDFSKNTQPSVSLGILLLETDVTLLSNHSGLLTNSSYRVTEARNGSDLFCLRGTLGIALVIMSDDLGSAALGLAAQAVRRDWPLARILILGKAQFVIEDYLYDEVIEHQLVDDTLLKTIRRICHPSANRGRDGGIFVLPRNAIHAESKISSKEA